MMVVGHHRDADELRSPAEIQDLIHDRSGVGEFPVRGVRLLTEQDAGEEYHPCRETVRPEVCGESPEAD